MMNRPSSEDDIRRIDGPDLFAQPIEQFYDWHQENGPAADLEAGDIRFIPD